MLGWVGGNRAKKNNSYFRVADELFQPSFSVESEQKQKFAPMVQELVDYRLASYEVRLGSEDIPNNVVPIGQAVKSNGRVELPYFPNLKIACGHFKTGTADAEEYRALGPAYGRLDPERHFIARASGNSMNGGKHPIKDGDYLLLEFITPTRAGSITGAVMAIERQDETGEGSQYLLRTVVKSPEGMYILRASNSDYEDLQVTEDMRTLARLKDVIDPLDLAIGRAFMREDIPALFGDEFSVGKWNVGHISLPAQNAAVLLVTINKQGKAADHRYMDHWIDDKTFHWQSQNSTTSANKKGREIIEHEKLGTKIHLFVRDAKLSNGKASPFIYHGTVRYKSHLGSGPMSVVFEIEE